MNLFHYYDYHVQNCRLINRGHSFAEKRRTFAQRLTADNETEQSDKNSLPGQ
jgi:hypothetical protein